MWEWFAPSAITGLIGGFLSNVLLQRRTRWIEMQILSRVLAREVLLLNRKLEAASKLNSIRQPSIEADDMLIFRSNTAKLGLLESWLALRTMKFYGFVRDAVSRQRDQNNFRDDDVKTAFDVAFRYGKYGASGQDEAKGLVPALEAFGRCSFSLWLWFGLAQSRTGRWFGSQLRRVNTLKRLAYWLRLGAPEESVE